jgi:hypothetical protein
MKLAALIFLVLVVLPLAVHEAGGSENSLPVVQASEILVKIQKGEPVEYDHVTVKGDLDLGKLDLQTQHVNRTSFYLFFLPETSKVVTSRIRINDSTFDGSVSINNTILNETIDLSGSNFTKAADFLGATFGDEAKSYGTNVDANFSGATFSGEANFSEATFVKKAIFYNAQFNTTSFSYAQLDDAFFDGANFRGELSLDRAKYKNLYVRWNNITKLTYDASAYLLLIENFKKLGFLSDADNSYYEFRKEQFLHRKMTEGVLVYVSDFVAWFTYGFGKRPEFALVWSVFFVLLFGGIWAAIGSKKSENSERFWVDRIVYALSFSLTVFLSGTGKLFINTPTAPEIAGRSQLMINSIFNLERLLGAFFSIMFFLAITGMVLKSV